MHGGLLGPAAAAQHQGAPAHRTLQAVVFFWASWSAPCKHMRQVLGALAQQHGGAVAFLQASARAGGWQHAGEHQKQGQQQQQQQVRCQEAAVAT